MAFSRTLPGLGMLLLLCATVSVAGTTSKKQSIDQVSTKHSSHAVHHKKSRKRRARGQQAIDAVRAREIQQALIREHYLKGQPSGKWDIQTQQAMKKYQADQGWQNKSVPDARALIRLGLGPDQEHLLNPESAMTTGPNAGRRVSEPASRSAAASAASSIPAAQMATPASVTSGTPEQ
jgi:peptidoglycan hydrolase-like protein with peptidoglycan-binding domain